MSIEEARNHLYEAVSDYLTAIGPYSPDLPFGIKEYADAIVGLHSLVQEIKMGVIKLNFLPEDDDYNKEMMEIHRQDLERSISLLVVGLQSVKKGGSMNVEERIEKNRKVRDELLQDLAAFAHRASSEEATEEEMRVLPEVANVIIKLFML